MECPGCGSARSIYSLLHGDILEAADFNLLLLILLPVLMIGIFTSLTGHCQKLWDIFNKPRIYLILISLFWIARNIPFFPFTVLHSDK